MYMIGEETPTAELRIVIRDGKQVLQQIVRIACEAQPDGRVSRMEWRDVPVVSEEPKG